MRIEMQDVSYAYPQGAQALDGISLRIGAGESVALLGHNGSGKSTLARHLNGLLHPDRGEVRIDSVPTTGQRVATLARTVALLFQNPDDQICRRQVWDEVAFGPERLGFAGERLRELVAGSLASMDLLEHGEANPHDLGFSQRKRLALASVLAMDTPVLVLDEPTAGLDAGEMELVAKVLDDLGERGRTVFIISHDMDFVAENVSRAICLEQGRTCFDGHVAELFANRPLLERCGLIPPQMTRLAERYSLSLDAVTPEGFMRAFGAGCPEKKG